MGNNLINGKSENGPVTVNARIKAKKGRIDEFEEWVDLDVLLYSPLKKINFLLNSMHDPERLSSLQENRSFLVARGSLYP